MAKHTHTIRKKLRTAINKDDNIAKMIIVMAALAMNKAEEYGHENVPPATMRACAKDLLEFGINAEKDLVEILADDKDAPTDSLPNAEITYINTKL